jgi:hypothetical protein
MAGMNIQAAGPGVNIRRQNDRVLLKMALERKGYQQARKETLEEDALQSGSPSRAASSQPAGRTLEIDQVEIHGVAVEVHAQNGQTSVDVLQVDVSAVRARLQGQAPKAKPKDPLVLDLTGDGPATTGREGGKVFDLQGKGASAPTSFVTGGSAFLALDRNGNGQIDSGLELFGDQHGAVDGFAELARFDANADGRIDVNDPIFGQLQLLYGDGHLGSLAEAGIASIHLAHGDGYSLSNGDEVLGQGSAYREDGQRVGTYALGLQQFEAQA